jgi:hypothetical protein
MNYEEFEKHILHVKDAYMKEVVLSEIFCNDGIVDLCDDLIDSIIDLLEKYFNDNSEWISYWMWELNFGEEYEPGMVLFPEGEVKLESIRDLYDLLMREK